MSELRSGERQVAPTLDGIRADHRARYEWAAERLAGGIVVDAGCGVGYGASVLGAAGCHVRAYDRSQDAVAYAQEHYNHNPNVKYNVGDLYDVQYPQNVDAVVCFEAIEHLTHPEKALHNFRRMAPRLLFSVPNEEVFPFRGQYDFHTRHYTRAQAEELMARNGWRVTEWWGQEGPMSPVEPEVNGRTLVGIAERVEGPVAIEPAPDPDEELQRHAINGKLPKSVSIVAMGASSRTYLALAAERGARGKYTDEVWVINAQGGVLQHDRVFAMDDLRIQKGRAEKRPETMVGGMMSWMEAHPGPIYTSKAYPEFPGAVEFPLEWVCNRTGQCYFNNTAAYAIAFAIALGVQELHLFGLDYSYEGDQNAHKRERGRACVEYWLGIAAQRGIALTVSAEASLLDANVAPRDRFYGYDAEWITAEVTQESGFRIGRVDRDPKDVPTPDQLEVRYSHDPRVEALEKKVAT